MSRKGHKDSYSHKVNVKLLNRVQSLLQIENGPDDSRSRRNALHLSAFHRFAIRGQKDTTMWIRLACTCVHTIHSWVGRTHLWKRLEKGSRPLCSGRQKEHKG